MIRPLCVPDRFLFTDYNRLSSVGGETSMAEMIATLSDACEREFGFMAARLFRVFKNDEVQGRTTATPSFLSRFFNVLADKLKKKNEKRLNF